MASVHDVAAFILAELGQIGTMKLQKLVYYSQAWSLVWDGKLLFPEKIEAWDQGPVVRELYNEHARMPIIDQHSRGEPARLSEDERASIRAVLAFYGKRSGKWLSELTHREPPWLEARARGARNPAILPVALRNFFATYEAQPRSIPEAVARGLDLLVSLPTDVVDDVLHGTPVEVHGLEEWLMTGKGNPWQTSGG